jgi:hypothetical protein
LDVLKEHDDEMLKRVAEFAEFDELQSKENEEKQKNVISIEGKMEKKSHGNWQKRFFKLNTRYSEETGNIFTLAWYKKKGDSVANSIECSKICGISLRESPR